MKIPFLSTALLTENVHYEVDYEVHVDLMPVWEDAGSPMEESSFDAFLLETQDALNEQLVGIITHQLGKAEVTDVDCWIENPKELYQKVSKDPGALKNVKITVTLQIKPEELKL